MRRLGLLAVLLAAAALAGAESAACDCNLRLPAAVAPTAAASHNIDVWQAAPPVPEVASVSRLALAERRDGKSPPVANRSWPQPTPAPPLGIDLKRLRAGADRSGGVLPMLAQATPAQIRRGHLFDFWAELHGLHLAADIWEAAFAPIAGESGDSLLAASFRPYDGAPPAEHILLDSSGFQGSGLAFIGLLQPRCMRLERLQDPAAVPAGWLEYRVELCGVGAFAGKIRSRDSAWSNLQGEARRLLLMLRVPVETSDAAPGAEPRVTWVRSLRLDVGTALADRVHLQLDDPPFAAQARAFTLHFNPDGLLQRVEPGAFYQARFPLDDAAP